MYPELLHVECFHERLIFYTVFLQERMLRFLLPDCTFTMDAMDPLKSNSAWKKLQAYAEDKAKKLQMRSMFEQDPKRFDTYR